MGYIQVVLFLLFRKMFSSLIMTFLFQKHDEFIKEKKTENTYGPKEEAGKSTHDLQCPEKIMVHIFFYGSYFNV